MSQDILGDNVSDFVSYALRKGRYPQFARKFFKVGDVSGLSGAINIVYGAIVYDQVNREANAHAVLKKENWERSGFRVVTTEPSTGGYGGADPDADTSGSSTQGTIGANIDASPTEIDSIPGFYHTPFNLTMDAGFRGNHDDGLDIWEWKLAIMRDIHARNLDKQLLLNAETEASALTANTTDAKNDANGAGIETLDRLIASDAEENAVGGSYTGAYNVYEGQVSRDSSSTFDSVVVRPDGSKSTFGTDLAFQLAGLNTLIDDTEANGADPASALFLTKRDSRRAFYNELGSQGRYDITSVQAKLDMGGLSTTATHPGRDITFTQRAYQDRPIVADKNVASDGKGRWYLIDQRHAQIRVGFPTLYVDVDNPVVRGQFDQRAIYLTCEQTYLTRFNTSGKLRSIA